MAHSLTLAPGDRALYARLSALLITRTELDEKSRYDLHTTLTGNGYDCTDIENFGPLFTRQREDLDRTVEIFTEKDFTLQGGPTYLRVEQGKEGEFRDLARRSYDPLLSLPARLRRVSSCVAAGGIAGSGVGIALSNIGPILVGMGLGFAYGVIRDQYSYGTHLQEASQAQDQLVTEFFIVDEQSGKNPAGVVEVRFANQALERAMMRLPGEGSDTLEGLFR